MNSGLFDPVSQFTECDLRIPSTTVRNKTITVTHHPNNTAQTFVMDTVDD